MCGKKLFIFFYLFFLLCALVVPQTEEPEQWYLISESELQSIETLLEKSEREKASWLSQAQRLRQDSETSNSLLAQAREQNRRLEQSFNAFEADQLARLSLKNGEIAELKQEVAAAKLEKEKEKQKNMELSAESQLRLKVIIALAGLLFFILGYTVYRFFRVKLFKK